TWPASRPDRPSARDCADDQQEEDRASDRDQPGPEVEEIVDVADVQRARDEAAEQRSEDSHGRGAEATARFRPAGDQRACDEAGEETQEDPGDDPHLRLAGA